MGVPPAAARAQQVRGELQAPTSQVLHRRLTDQAGKSLGEGRARQPDRIGKALAPIMA